MKVKKTRNFSDAPPLDVQYNYIMENFDFDKVLEYMSWDKSHRTYDDDGKCVGKRVRISDYANYILDNIFCDNQDDLLKIAILGTNLRTNTQNE